MTRASSVLLLALLLALGAGQPARAQCEGYVGEPYVFVLFDTSGSLNLSPPCSQAQFDLGECSFLCPTGDCFVPLQGDDPASKMYQLKEALHTALADEQNLQLGFATFNQDSLRVRAKHWLYEATTSGPDVPVLGTYPLPGARELFGQLWNCDTGTGSHDTGCMPSVPADLSDPWEAARMQRLPKGGTAFNQNVVFYLRTTGLPFRVTYQPLAGHTLGNPEVRVRVTIARCNTSSCSTVGTPSTSDVTWQRVSELISWDNAGSSPNRTNPELSYFSQSAAADASAGNICSGWDPNTDTTSDRYNGYSLRWPTTSDPRGPLLHTGDVVPLDWTDSHLDDVLLRLAPNLANNPLDVPDFRVSPYLRDVPIGVDSFLRLKDERLRPLLPNGGTPLSNALLSFRTWFAGCAVGNCPSNAGWQAVAAGQDPDWLCRRKALVVLSDGEDNCTGPNCLVAAQLLQLSGVQTYAVGFAVDPLSTTQFACLAANGGTGDARYPQTKQQLIDTLDTIFAEIAGQTP